MREGVNSERREFIKKSGILIATAAVIQPAHLIAQETAKSNPEKGSQEQKEIEISPVEDLMREHGALARILLVYDEMIIRAKQRKGSSCRSSCQFNRAHSQVRGRLP